MSCGSPIDLYSRLLVLLVCWVSTSHVTVSDAAGVRTITTVGEENKLKSETQRFLHNAYVPGRQQHFPVGPILSQRARTQLLPETDGANEPSYHNSVIVRASHLMGPLTLDPHNAVAHDLVVLRGGGGSKARYLQPRIFRGDRGHSVGTRKSASSSNHGRLNPKESTLQQKLTRANGRPFALLGPSRYRSIEPTGFRNIQTHPLSSDETSSVHKLGQSWGSFGGVLSNDGKATWQTEGLADGSRFSPRFAPPLAGQPNTVLDPADEEEVPQSTQGRTVHWSPRLSPQALPQVFSPVLSSRSGALRKSHPVEPSMQRSTGSVITREPELIQSNEKAPISDGLISFGNKHSTLNTPKLGPDTKVSEPAEREPIKEPTVLKAGKSYLFNFYKTSGKREAADVSGAMQRSGQSLSPSTWSQSLSPSFKMAGRQPSYHSQDQLSEQEASNSDVQTHFKAPPKGFEGPGWLKSQESVVEDYKKPPAIPYGGLSKKTKLQSYSYDKTTNQQTEKARNFTLVSQKYGFSRRAGVVVTTTAPLEAEKERGPQKYSIQSGSNSILPPRDNFRSDSEMPNKSMLSANVVPSQQGKYKVLQHSNVPLKLNKSKSESKPEFRGVQPLILNMGSKPYLRGYTSNGGKYRFGGLTGLPFRTSISGQLEGAYASDTNTTGNDILKPPKNEMFSLKAITREEAPSLSQGYLQGASAVYRIGTKTSHAEEIVKPSVIQSTPDGKEEKLLKGIPITDDDFSNRPLTTSNAFLGPQSPSRHGHLPSHASSFPGPFEGEVSGEVGGTVLSSETWQSENHPGWTKVVPGPKDTVLASGNAEFTQKHREWTPVNATKKKPYSDLRKPHSSVFAFGGSHLYPPQKYPKQTPKNRPTAPSSYPRWAIETPLALLLTRVPRPRTEPAPSAVPMNGNFLNRPSRPMVRGRRVKSKGIVSGSRVPTARSSKSASAFLNVTYSDILGSASFRGVASTSQNGSKAADRESSRRTKPRAWYSLDRFRPWEGSSSSSEMDSRPAPKLNSVEGSSEQAGRGGERVQFSSVRGASGGQRSGHFTHSNNIIE